MYANLLRKIRKNKKWKEGNSNENTESKKRLRIKLVKNISMVRVIEKHGTFFVPVV